ncbi:serine/arginine repetitive matrix protein 5-like [Mizuhopecten yessoensis]|uniref:Cytoskeleton-associated protein 2-like n=1 Tax=Mizuhopecten yessoensis TaxID=6573 RepID=A0A210QFA6_MIZYE|nr:serine/arginine repetitive matrix protein 5-like [Mizuhopecten yessoensis]OWF47424.1 Cytoskeleton-associated protein 2-like [Mizuhopecten yessoensis]
MADAHIGNRGKQTPGLKSGYIEKFIKYKQAKQTEPLQERGNRPTSKNGGQKRKSCPVTTTKVPFKKTKENRASVIPSTDKSKPHRSTTNMVKKPAVSQTATPKPMSAADKGGTEREPTPMLERLQRWKEEKEQRALEKSNYNRKSCQGLSSSSKKYLKPGGPCPLEQSHPKRSDTAPKLTGTQKTVSKTTHRTPSNKGSVSKWERLSRGSSAKSRDGAMSNITSNSETSVSGKGFVTGGAERGVIRSRSQGAERGVIRSRSQGAGNKHQTKTRGPISEKAEVKRRHSEVQARVSPLRRPGILKRKSCIASFGDNGETETSNRAKSDDGQTTLSPSSDTPGHTTVRALPCRTPDTARTVRFCSPGGQRVDTTVRKTPSKQSKEESMRNKLNDWLDAKGKTPSKFRHLMCFDAKMSARKKNDPKTKRSITVEELTEQQETMERESTVAVNLTGMFDRVADEEEEEVETGEGATQEDPGLSQLRTILDECTILFEAGCPYTDILKWLDSIEQNLPLARKSAIFYICKAQVLQSTADLDKVLKVFEEAVIKGAQPAQELATALTAIVKEVSEERERKAHQKGIKKRVQEENIFESTSIKYCVRQVTPFSKRSRRSTGDSSIGSQCKVLTPVRRSTRRSLVNLPDTLQEKTPVFNTLEELSDSDKKKTLYKENEALEPIMLDFNDSGHDIMP